VASLKKPPIYPVAAVAPSGDGGGEVMIRTHIRIRKKADFMQDGGTSTPAPTMINPSRNLLLA
jgi:hypothetical protein